MSPLQIIMILLLIVSFSAVVLWFITLIRVGLCVRASISMLEGVDLPEPEGGWPTVSVVIPAHQEEDVIERCARSLMAQRYSSFEVVFALDRCTDQTESLLRAIIGDDPRFKIVLIDECPDDWAGKCNAAAAGTRHATGDFLLFTDADTDFDPDLIRSSVAIALRDEADLLSVLSTLSITRWDELVVQPVATLNLLRMHPLDQVNRKHRPRAFANGQFMLFKRSMYERLGGHAEVHLDLLEDIAFARAVQANSGRSILVNADGMLKVSMYDSLRSLREGWKRIYVEIARRRPMRLRILGTRALMGGVIVPLLEVLTIVIGIILLGRGDVLGFILGLCSAVPGLLLQVIALTWIYWLGRTPILGVLGFPIGSLFVAIVMFDAARDIAAGRPIRWGGRDYILEPN
ncbi:MAG: glycosyltransferase [Phycisphaerales bacterium]|nr:glycosyltransferase [Phycisphaerales bacterium]